MPLSGDTRKLERLFQQFSSGPKIPHQVAQAARPVVQSQLEHQFETATSPDGESWKALKKPTGRRPLAGLKDFFLCTVLAATILIRSSKFYTVFHQKGTRVIPARSFLPEGTLSASWKSVLAVPIRSLIHRLFRS